MNECLVTKLKKSVMDDSLRFIGELRFEKSTEFATTSDTVYFQISSKNEINVKILNDGIFLKNDATPDIELGKDIVLTPGLTHSLFVSLGSIVSITPRYDIDSLTLVASKFDISELSYMPELKKIYASGKYVSGNVEVLDGSKLEVIQLFSSASLYGDLSKISKLSNLKTLEVRDTNIEGDIVKVLGRSLQLSRLYAAGSKLTGSIEGLVASQIASGRNSGEIEIPYARSVFGITYKGIALAENSELPANAASNKLSWASNGTITWS